MKEKTIIFFSIFILLFISYYLSGENELQINVKMERVSNLPYLPIYFTIEFHNSGSDDLFLPKTYLFRDYLRIEVEGSKQDMYCSELNEAVCRDGIFEVFAIKAGESYVHRLNVACYAGILDPGIYRVKVVWDSRKAPKGYQGYAESKWIDIQIDEPTVVDKQLIEEYINRYGSFAKCLCQEASKLPEDLILKYPTSTYVGWQLMKGGPYPFLASAKELIDDLFLPYNKRKGRIFYEEEAMEYEKSAEKYLYSHSEDEKNLMIWMRLAIVKAVLHKWQEAYEAAEKSLSREWPELFFITAPNTVAGWRKTLLEFKEELIKRGLAKAK